MAEALALILLVLIVFFTFLAFFYQMQVLLELPCHYQDVSLSEVEIQNVKCRLVPPDFTQEYRPAIDGRSLQINSVMNYVTNPERLIPWPNPPIRDNTDDDASLCPRENSNYPGRYLSCNVLREDALLSVETCM